MEVGPDYKSRLWQHPETFMRQKMFDSLKKIALIRNYHFFLSIKRNDIIVRLTDPLSYYIIVLTKMPLTHLPSNNPD